MLAVTVRSPWIPRNYGKYSPTDPIWEVLIGVGVDGVGGNFPFCRFSSVFLFSLFFLRFSPNSPRTRANNCYLLEKWAISLRPRLQRPRPELPGKSCKAITVNRYLANNKT